MIYRKKVWHNIHDLNDNINSKYFFQLTYQKSYLVIKCSKKYLAIWVNILEMWIKLVSLRRNKSVKTFSLLLAAKYFGLPMSPTNFTRTTSFTSNTYEMHEVGVVCSGELWRAISSKNISFNKKLWVIKFERSLPVKTGSKLKKRDKVIPCNSKFPLGEHERGAMQKNRNPSMQMILIYITKNRLGIIPSLPESQLRRSEA